MCYYKNGDNMISDFINIDKKSNTPLYLQIYNEIKTTIENGNLKEDEKIPSIRKLCADLNVSKTTVESAYGMLCSDGYIINKPQKGYYIEKGLYINKNSDKISDNKQVHTIYKYDFSGKGIDKNCTNIKEWRKYVKDILNKEYLLNTYSENQGEKELRDALSKYAFSTRGASISADNIIIGSGSQTLIYILCGMLGLNKTVAIEKNSFPQAEQVFRDFKYNVMYVESDNKGISLNSLEKIKPDVLIINPNFISTNGSTVPISRRIELIKWADNNNCYIIEDDYNGEMRYKTHSKACIQSLSRERVIYIGSFSKILLPSVRISYMALPEKLIEQYNTIRENYNQTTSKIEQLALAEYIRDGSLEKYLRKSRRYYLNKYENIKLLIKKYFNNYIFNETAMYFEIPFNKDMISICKKASIKPMRTSTENKIKLNFSQIEEELLPSAIETLYNISK